MERNFHLVYSLTGTFLLSFVCDTLLEAEIAILCINKGLQGKGQLNSTRRI